MPSALIHLKAGKYAAETLYKNKGKTPDICYYVGNVAPDSVSRPRELKDKMHLRIYPHNERVDHLAEMAHNVGGDEYRLGALLHLWADLCWDEGPQSEHHNTYVGEDWFHDYRNEISLASSYIYHSEPWGKPMWQNMLASNLERDCVSLDAYTADDIRGYLERNGKWHDENVIGPSPAFPPEAVEKFCRECVDSFLKFYEKEGKQNA